MKNCLLTADKYIELSLHECGREKCISNKVFHFTPKEYHLFHYVVSGKGYFEINGNMYPLKRGCIFYVPPHVVPHYYPDKEDPWQYIWLGYSGSNAKKYLDMIGLSIDNPVFRDTADYQLKYVFEELYETYSDLGYLDIRCLGMAYQIFGQMISCGKAEEKSLNCKSKHINGAKDFINNNYQLCISINDIANSVGVSPNYLANIFNEVESSSPKKYLTKVRMEKACLLLKTGGYKIKEVGSMVGYKNQLHFSGEFKKNIGVSPLEYNRANS